MSVVHICCGVGGTGKTTTAAALGVGYALSGKRVVVLTIDPARRLASALGLDTLDNRPRRVEVPGATGSLDALMLDRKATFDGIIERYSGDPERAAKLLNNRYYSAVSTRLTGSHEYMAIEKLHELVSADEWDVVVVDTPPARHVLDFFEAPERVQRVFDRTVLSAMVQPREGWLGGAGLRAMGIVHKLAGDSVMGDVSEFFGLVQDLSDGFRSRHTAVAELLSSDRTLYWLVANAEAPERNDLAGFLDVLKGRGMKLGGFLLNRCASEPPKRLPKVWPDLPVEDTAAWKAALVELVDRQRRRHAAHRAAAHRLSVRAHGAPVWMVPDLPEGLRSTEGLARLSEYLPPHDPTVA